MDCLVDGNVYNKVERLIFGRSKVRLDMDKRKKDRRGKRGLSNYQVIKAVELMIDRLVRDIKFERKTGKEN